MSKADYFQKMGCEDALSGKLLTNTLQYFIRQFGFEHENTQSYISGYESSLKESLPLLKKASEEKEIREKLMAQLSYVLGADLDEEERDTHIPVEHIYGTQMKKAKYVSFGSSIGLRVEFKGEDCNSPDDIDEVYLVHYGFTHVEIALASYMVQQLLDADII